MSSDEPVKNWFLSEPEELIVQPDCPLDGDRYLISAGVLYRGAAYNMLFALSPPRIASLTRDSLPVDIRREDIKELFGLLNQVVIELADRMLSSGTEGEPHDSIEESHFEESHSSQEGT